MANDFTTDPFTQIHDKLWETLEDDETFCSLVDAGNRIKYSRTKERPRKNERMSADMPEVTIIPEGGSIDLHLTSHAVIMTRRFTIVLQSGSLRANLQLYPLEWQVLKILYNASDTLNLSFVKRFRITNATLTREDTEAVNNRLQWSSSLSVEVDAIIPKTDLAL